MNLAALELLRSYYYVDPEGFLKILNGTSVLSKTYQALVDEVISGINVSYRSISGATIAQLDLDGSILMINSDVKFFNTKEEVKQIHCGVEKFGNNLLVTDNINKTAVILNLDVKTFSQTVQYAFAGDTTDISQINQDFFDNVFKNLDVSVAIVQPIWQYQSSRYITSFCLVPVDYQEINIDDDAIRDSQVFIRQGTTVKWLNNSSKPVSVYSGKTYYDQFTLDPNLDLYGKEFKSPVIQPGESWSYKFVSVGENNWFVYPDILTGAITVTRERLNSNDQFLIVENDNLGQPFSSRVIRVDSWGNVVWAFGEAYLVNPRSARPLLNNGIIVSA